MTTNQEFESQYGVQPHERIQTVNGVTYEFRPKHLLCDECWRRVDSAFARATYVVQATAYSYGECAITVKKKNINPEGNTNQ